MRTLVGEGIGAFIVVGHEHPLVGLEVFSCWGSPWSVLYGILSLLESLWIMRSMESKLFSYIHDAWVASKHWLVPSACNNPLAFTPSPYEGVSLLRASAPWRSHLRLPITSDKCYGSWRSRKLPSTSIVAVHHVVEVKHRST